MGRERCSAFAAYQPLCSWTDWRLAHIYICTVYAICQVHVLCMLTITARPCQYRLSFRNMPARTAGDINGMLVFVYLRYVYGSHICVIVCDEHVGRSVVFCRLPSRDRATLFQWSDPYLATWPVVTRRPLCVVMGIVLNRLLLFVVFLCLSPLFFRQVATGIASTSIWLSSAISHCGVRSVVDWTSLLLQVGRSVRSLRPGAARFDLLARY